MQDIQNNSIILAPASLHPLIQRDLLSKKNGYLGVTIQTIESYLLSQIQTIEQFDDVLFQYLQIMQQEKSKLQIYRDICTKDYFLEQCMKFINDLKFYNISLSSLPKETQEEKELFYIIQALYPISLRNDYLKKALDNYTKSKKQVYIYPSFLTYEQSYIQQKLLEEGAILLENFVDASDISFYHAINMREEIEGLAQYIIQNQLEAEDCAITICNAQYKHLIQQIFTRYQIPFTTLSKSAINQPANKICALLNYYLNPDKNNLFKVLDHQLFPNVNTIDLKEYMNLFHKDLQDTFFELNDVESNLLSNYEINKLRELRNEAVVAQQQLQEILNPLMELSWQEALVAIFDILKATLDLKKDKSSYLQLQTYIQNVYPYLHTKEDLSFLINRIMKLSSSQSNKELQGAIVETLTTLLPNRPYHFIIGTTQADYPSFPLKKGIFDETYLAKIPYPSLQERYDYHLQQVDQHLHQSKHLWISYPLGNYEGKGKEAALEIESFVNKKAVPLCVQYSSKSYTLETSIPAQLARNLYLKNDVLYGSISSLEKYIKCPYSYYLKYGLRIKEPFKANFDESKAGTLSHHILEVLSQNYGKDYVQTQTNKVEELLQQEFQSLLHIYPHQQNWASLFQQRLLLNISQNLTVLKEMEEHSEMSIFKSEYEFYRDYNLDDTTLRLHGFIDRIDQKNEFIRIIDYKSSPKSLVEHDVFAALQLQLITYGIVAQHDFQKKLLGAYYISLKNENIPYSAGKMKRRPVEYVPFQKADYEDSIFLAHRMQGWNTDKHLEYLDDNGSHVIGISMNKSGEVKSRKLYNMNVLEQHFQTIYQTIGKRILSGDISLTPDEFACTYCPYHEICRYKGFPHKKDPLIEIDDQIYQE